MTRHTTDLRIEILMEDFQDAAGYYLITYRAPTLYYFARDRETFETVCASFRV